MMRLLICGLYGVSAVRVHMHALSTDVQKADAKSLTEIINKHRSIYNHDDTITKWAKSPDGIVQTLLKLDEDNVPVVEQTPCQIDGHTLTWFLNQLPSVLAEIADTPLSDQQIQGMVRRIASAAGNPSNLLYWDGVIEKYVKQYSEEPQPVQPPKGPAVNRRIEQTIKILVNHFFPIPTLDGDLSLEAETGEGQPMLVRFNEQTTVAQLKYALQAPRLTFGDELLGPDQESLVNCGVEDGAKISAPLWVYDYHSFNLMFDAFRSIGIHWDKTGAAKFLMGLPQVNILELKEDWINILRYVVTDEPFDDGAIRNPKLVIVVFEELLGKRQDGDRSAHIILNDADEDEQMMRLLQQCWEKVWRDEKHGHERAKTEFPKVFEFFGEPL